MSFSSKSNPDAVNVTPIFADSDPDMMIVRQFFSIADLNEIARRLGRTQAVEKFVKDICRSLWFDQGALKYMKGYAANASEQKPILQNIRDGCDALLDALRPLESEDEQGQPQPINTPLALLIQSSLWHVRRDEWIRRVEQSSANEHADSRMVTDALAELGDVARRAEDVGASVHDSDSNRPEETCESVPLNYANDIFCSLKELRNAVAHAVDSIGKREGNSPHRYSENIRKHRLAKDFVRSYCECFKKYPPMSTSAGKTSSYPVYDVYVMFLRAANLAGHDESHYFKEVIRKSRDTWGKVRNFVDRVKQPAALSDDT